jgi:hypothetical protein
VRSHASLRCALSSAILRPSSLFPPSKHLFEHQFACSCARAFSLSATPISFAAIIQLFESLCAEYSRPQWRRSACGVHIRRMLRHGLHAAAAV